MSVYSAHSDSSGPSDAGSAALSQRTSQTAATSLSGRTNQTASTNFSGLSLIHEFPMPGASNTTNDTTAHTPVPPQTPGSSVSPAHAGATTSRVLPGVSFGNTPTTGAAIDEAGAVHPNVGNVGDEGEQAKPKADRKGKHTRNTPSGGTSSSAHGSQGPPLFFTGAQDPTETDRQEALRLIGLHMADCADQHQAISADINTMTGNLASLAKLMSDVSGDMGNVGTSMQNVSTIITALDAKVEGTGAQVHSVRQEMAAVRQDVQGNGAQVHSVRQEMAAVKQEVQDTKREVQALGKEVLVLTKGMQGATTAIAKLNVNVASIREDVDNVTSAVTSYKNNLDTIEHEVKELREMGAAAQETMKNAVLAALVEYGTLGGAAGSALRVRG